IPDPAFRQHLALAPAAAARHEQTQAGVIAGADDHATTPVPATRYRLHAPAVNLSPRRRIAVPLPSARCSDRIHDALTQHIGQRSAKPLQQAERQQVHAYVVVFEVGAWRHRLAALALAALIGPPTRLPVVVDLIGLSPQLTLPPAPLLQPVAPGDARVGF